MPRHKIINPPKLKQSVITANQRHIQTEEFNRARLTKNTISRIEALTANVRALEAENTELRRLLRELLKAFADGTGFATLEQLEVIRKTVEFLGDKT
jgi:hypothetical protein